MPKSDEKHIMPGIAHTFESPRKEDEHNFRIYSEVEILAILSTIMQANTLITLYFDNARSFILTSILAINVENKEIIMDYGVDQKLNQDVLRTNKLTFITSQNRIKIEFACDTIRKIQFGNLEAFAVKIPEFLMRMQRRNYFRITTPTTKPLKCMIPLPSGNSADIAEITLLDISCGGIAVIDHHPVISFDPGKIYKHCQITLPGIGTVNVAIQVKNTYQGILLNGLACKRAGCQFIALSTRMQAMIQRYIIKQEQIQRAAE